MQVKPRSLAVIFIAAVIVPSILLAVLSIRAATREEALVEGQLAAPLYAEVTQVAGLANAEVDRVLDQLRAGIQLSDTADYARILPQWQRATPLVAVPFLLSPRYGILWPRSSGTRNDAERLFLQENGDFLGDKATATVLQNIALRHQKEILQQESSSLALLPASSAEESEASSDSKQELRETSGLGDLSANTESQMALDAFAQSPAVQSKVYEAARAQGEKVTPRVAQPLARMAQNAPEAPPAAEAAAPAAGALAATAPAASAQEARKDSVAVTGGASANVAEALAKPAAPAEAAAAAPAPVAPLAGKSDKSTPSQQRQPEQQSQFVVTSRLLSQIASQGDFGLIPRFVGDRLVFLFWERQKDGRIAGCQIDEAAFRRRIAEVLPSTASPVRILTILDERGAPLAVPPEGAARDWRRPFVAREIGELLPRWEAASYLASADVLSAPARFSSLVMWIMVGILIVSVAGGGTMVLASVSSEMRLAQKKATFVTNVSHELKTPLTAISLFIELLQQKRRPPAAKRERYLSLMASETERLTRLINNVLDFSSMERGSKRYAKEPIDAAAEVREIAESQRVRLESKGFSLIVKAEKADGRINGDPQALKQLVLNLLSNAEKYSPSTKEIEVLVESGADGVCIHVSDRGIGVPEKERERIFREFFRVNDSLSSGVQGTGLGLTIARRIARDHGGDIVCAQREGGGSDFIVRLPGGEQ